MFPFILGRSSKKHTPHPTTEASSSTSSTPCGSKVDFVVGEERKHHPVDEVITGEDVQALRVREEDLRKVKWERGRNECSGEWKLAFCQPLPIYGPIHTDTVETNCCIIRESRGLCQLNSSTYQLLFR